MKRYILTPILCVAAAHMASAQAITASGTVKNDKGEVIASALVQEADSKTATYTDSQGFFTLPTKSNAEIIVSAKGYKDETIKPQKDAVVVLEPGKSKVKGQALDDPNKASKEVVKPNNSEAYAFYNVGGTDRNSSYGGGMMFNVTHKEDTKGSKYLVDGSWAKGYVVDKTGATVKNDNFGFNYDKIGGVLLLTQDQRAAVEVDRDQIKAFTIYAMGDQPQTYEVIAGINPTHYSQVLVDGGKYKVYKYTKTTFVKSDFKTDGMTSTGNKYDEYVDEPTYYVLNVGTSALQKVALKGKAIKQIFAADADKVKTYFNDHADDDINEAFLKDLANSLN